MSILEVGCGSGELLHELADIGVTNVIGIDPFVPSSSKYKNGAIIIKTTIFDLAKHIQDEKFDLILFNHSLEHSPTPFQDLEYATKYLKSNGEILVRMPISGSEIANKYCENWWGLDAPRHIYLFSAKSMPMLAKRCGLTLKRTHFEGTIDDFLASEQHAAGIPLLSEKSYVVTKDFSVFGKDKILQFQRSINDQNRLGTAAQAGFIFGFPD